MQQVGNSRVFIDNTSLSNVEESTVYLSIRVRRKTSS
jgi:hypothetical protein